VTGTPLSADRPGTGEDGFSVIVTMLSLVVSALLIALVLGTTLHSGGSSPSGVDSAPGVAMANGIQTQQALTTALGSIATASTTSGGYGSLQPADLTAINPGVHVVAGPSANSSTISMATASTGAGSVTLAALAPDRTCWLIWSSPGSATWYGAQQGLTSCVAPALPMAPTAGPVTSTSIGWHQGSFPLA
jgi:hypothetical protein